MKLAKVILVHGNSGGNATSLWLPSVKKELELAGIPTTARTMPGNIIGREKKWLPFLRDVLGADEQSIIVGHSTGAIAAMRYAENYPILGSVLVAAYHSDLNSRIEKMSGYFNRPWEWDKIRANQEWVIQFASTDDPWIPIEEARYIYKQLNTDYHESSDQGHFGGDYYKEEFPELVTAIIQKLNTT